MSQFFWAGGHFGWGFFACVVITAICWLSGDIAWRLRHVAIKRLLLEAVAGWACSIVACVLVWLAVTNG